ncbi:helix-turn-helix domain-containing protein [Dyadobacter subterraneus]|uniref:Helix-turn-helix transcriptional regulator n=1 Tax=Dyadobacter subterraneus TaxID=2773304 RepID=A0ABR9WA21_9BACT|nr:helix-turn-helix transcriptional regulator [Dyadobacter subterraneus]MBE9462337.1 helix-turn-helix transcriptional regulator [Dyadobacter subterraneus]
MKMQPPYNMFSIQELHRTLELPKPEHPLVSVINFEDIKCYSEDYLRSVSYNFYCISIKRNFKGKMKYGQNYYDYDDGIMTFFAPGQVVSTDIAPELELSGWWLVFHSDFIQRYPLAKTIREYGYFSYAVNEALHLSEKEEAMVTGIMKNIRDEYHSRIDAYSQNVIISHIELLLNYCDRFYNRQFITRKNINHDLLTRLELLLSDYFVNQNVRENGVPTVQFVSEQLNVSPNYLSDMLRSLTGQTTQQHIHDKLIEKAKEILTTTSLSVGEIAYQLGFEYPQSFNKLFKNKAGVSPLEFRQSFN